MKSFDRVAAPQTRFEGILGFVRVLVWYWGQRGGGAQYSASVCEALAQQPNCQVVADVLGEGEGTPRARAASEHLVARDVRTISGLFRSVFGDNSIGKRAQALGVDVALHTMVHPFSPLGLWSLRRAGIPVVSVIHDAVDHPGDEKWLLGRARTSMLRRSTAVVVPSVHVRDQLDTRVPDSVGVHIVGLGPHLRMADSWGPTGAVVFVGRLLPYKGLGLLAEAWALLAGQLSSLPRLIVSGEDQGGVAVELDDLRRCGADVQTTWMSQDEMVATIGGARLVVLPYQEASQSGVVTLAREAKVPVLATKVGGLSEQVGSLGFLVEPNAEALANELFRLIAEPGHLDAAHQQLVATTSTEADFEALGNELVAVLKTVGMV